MQDISNKFFENTLQKFLENSCVASGKNPDAYKIRQDVHRDKELFKKSWFLKIDNFNDLYAVKRVNNDKYVRYLFAIALTNLDGKLQLIVTKWVPSMGAQENRQVIFQRDIGSSDEEFLALMIAALKMPVSKLSVRY